MNSVQVQPKVELMPLELMVRENIPAFKQTDSVLLLAWWTVFGYGGAAIMLLLIITVAGMLCGAIVDGDGWSPVQGANYVPSYSKHDVHIIGHITIQLILELHV